MVNLNQIVALVDDNESIRRAIKRLLRSVGIQAVTFSSGEEFLNVFSSAASYWPACVILDFEMPGINGLELQHRLTPTLVPIIFTTANDDPTVREKALASGAAGYLRKPFDDTTLVAAVGIALGSAPILKERLAS
jgi:FixJ family two-component response regulator